MTVYFPSVSFRSLLKSDHMTPPTLIEGFWKLVISSSSWPCRRDSKSLSQALPDFYLAQLETSWVGISSTLSQGLQLTSIECHGATSMAKWKKWVRVSDHVSKIHKWLTYEEKNRGKKRCKKRGKKKKEKKIRPSSKLATSYSMVGPCLFIMVECLDSAGARTPYLASTEE